MTHYKLNNVDIEDVEEVLKKVETSFGLKFANGEMAHVKTFGQLCDYIGDKIELDNSKDCTSQQAFYKLRAAMSQTLNLDVRTITLDSSITTFFPRQQRRARLKAVERLLDFKLRLLRPPQWATGTLLVVFLVSIIAWFFDWRIGLFGVSFSIVGLWVSRIVGNELEVQTLGQIVEKMKRENYLKSRRDPKTYNKQEVEKVLIDLFSIDLGLDKSVLTRDATFN